MGNAGTAVFVPLCALSLLSAKAGERIWVSGAEVSSDRTTVAQYPYFSSIGLVITQAALVDANGVPLSSIDKDLVAWMVPQSGGDAAPGNPYRPLSLSAGFTFTSDGDYFAVLMAWATSDLANVGDTIDSYYAFLHAMQFPALAGAIATS